MIGNDGDRSDLTGNAAELVVYNHGEFRPTISRLHAVNSVGWRPVINLVSDSREVILWVDRAAYKNNNPDTVNYPGLMEWPPNGGNESGDNYGNELIGYFIPSASGAHTFYVSGDDHITVYLSPDANPANKQQICFEPNWNNARQWVATSRRNTAAPENISAPVTMIAGQKYFIDTIHQEGGGGDSVGVTVQAPGAPTPANGDLPISSANMSPYSSLGPVVITNDLPAAISIGELGVLTLTAGVDGTPPYTYQWLRNGTNIPGAIRK